MSEYRPAHFEKDEYEDEYPMAARMDRIRAFDPEKRVAHLRVFRSVMTAVGYFRQCPRKACRRARKCVGPRADCAWARLPYLQRYIIPALDKAAHARLAELEKAGGEKDNAPQPPPLPASGERVGERGRPSARGKPERKRP